jgi:ABC-type glycerol-3-phosphate transport system substrate-binding protein
MKIQMSGLSKTLRALLLGSVAVCIAAAPASATQLTFWTNLTTATQADVIRKQAEECRAEQPGLEINFETIPFSNMYTRLITAMRNDSVPDIMNTEVGPISFLQPRNGLAPMTDMVERLGRDDFLSSYLHAVSKDGEIWGLPDWALHQEVWYRKDLFEKAGIDLPTSWDELLAAAKALNIDENNDGTPEVYGFAVPMSRDQVAAQTFFQFFYAAGGTILDPDTGEYAFADHRDEAVKALSFMLELYKEASPPSSLEWTWSDYRNAFVQGKVAMTNEWGAVVLIAAEQNPEILDKMAAFAFPGPNKDAPAVASLNGGYYYLVGHSTPEREQAAKTLLACMYTPERVAERANSRPIFAIPAMRSAFHSDVYNANEYVQRFTGTLDTIFNDVMQSWYRYGAESGLNSLTGQIEATTFIGDAIQSAALGRITPEEAIDQIDAKLVYQIQLIGG